jgi:hypothetical protein
MKTKFIHIIRQYKAKFINLLLNKKANKIDLYKKREKQQIIIETSLRINHPQVTF